jgi:transketolase
VDLRSQELRKKVLYIAEHGKRGHLPSALSMMEIVRVLYDDIINYDIQEPWNTNRDRVILSKGHGCIALYTILEDKGFIGKEDLATFCKYEGVLGGHPEFRALPGIEASTGSLGHGASFAVGQAYAARLLNADYHVWVILGDGELNEGSVWEAAMSASHHKLSNLHFIVDANGKQASGMASEVWNLGDLVKKFEAFGFNTSECDGHDVSELKKILKESKNTSRPTCLIARTIKGKGFSELETKMNWHHKASISQEEISSLKSQL